MRNLQWISLIIVFSLMLVMVMPACAPEEAKEAAPEEAKEAAPIKEAGPIRIGLLASYTGPFAGKGQAVEKGAKLRLDEAGWEVAGREVELIVEDAGSSADVSMDKIRKLVDVDKVHIVMGPLMLDPFYAAAPYMSQRGLAILAPGTCDIPKVEEYESIYALYGPLESICYNFGTWARDNLPYGRLVLLSHDFPSGRVLVHSFTSGFEDKGGAILKEIFIPFGTMDFIPYMLEATGEDPDVVMVFLAGSKDVLRFYRQYSEVGLGLPVLAPEAGAITDVLQELGADILGVIGTVPYTAAIETDINRRFVENFTKTYGIPPSQNDERGYVQVSVILKAIEATADDPTPMRIAEALKGIKIDLPSGPFEIGGNRFGKKYMHIFECVERDGTIIMQPIDKYLNALPER